MLRLLRRDKPEPHRLCFAKKAAAFFRISRSSCRMRFSLRRRLSSSRSAVVSAPALPFSGSARACSTQFRSDDSVRSRSRAAGAHALALFQDQPDGARLELVSETAPGAAGLRVGHRRHRIRLSESVHEIRIKPTADSQRIVAGPPRPRWSTRAARNVGRGTWLARW